MRPKSKRRNRERPEVQLSPLIDCVFLLVIFFLVTSMFKRWEMQIPISLPDSSSAVAENASEERAIIGLDVNGQAYFGETGERGQIYYAPIEDIALHFAELIMTHGADYPILLAVDRKAPFRSVIKTLDIAQLQGIQNISVRMKDELR